MSRWWLCLTLLAVACSKPRTEPSPAAATAAPSAPVVAKALTQAEPETKLADESPPTEADFEDEAESKITAQNLEVELDQLEKELAQPIKAN
jgi:hypothetical protein